MTTLRTVKKLFLGETWLLPAGLAVSLGASLVVRHALGDHWHQAGGFVLLGAVITVVVVSVGRSARAR